MNLHPDKEKAIELFERNKYIHAETGCWLWTGSLVTRWRENQKLKKS